MGSTFADIASYCDFHQTNASNLGPCESFSFATNQLDRPCYIIINTNLTAPALGDTNNNQATRRLSPGAISRGGFPDVGGYLSETCYTCNNVTCGACDHPGLFYGNSTTGTGTSCFTCPDTNSITCTPRQGYSATCKTGFYISPGFSPYCCKDPNAQTCDNQGNSTSCKVLTNEIINGYCVVPPVSTVTITASATSCAAVANQTANVSTTTVTSTFYQTPASTITGGTQTGYVATTFSGVTSTFTTVVPPSTQTITTNGQTLTNTNAAVTAVYTVAEPGVVSYSPVYRVFDTLTTQGSTSITSTPTVSIIISIRMEQS